jgi:hypothetical protein
MWLVERHFKVLKEFVRHRSHPKGSMVESYMFYQSMVYINEYLPEVDINVPCIWDNKYTKKFELGEVLLRKGIKKKLNLGA